MTHKFERIALTLTSIGTLAVSPGAFAGEGAHHGGAPAKFETMDTNGDGKVSADEHAAAAKKMFDAMDTDHDGFLSKSELTAGHTKMMKKDKDKEAK